MSKLDWFSEVPDDHDVYDYLREDKPVYCEDCGAQMIIIIDNNYGADRDGNRGIYQEWYECPECG